MRRRDGEKKKRGDSCGRKLQAEFGRCETRVKISEISRCWTLVSCEVVVRLRMERNKLRRITDELCVEFGKAGLAGVVKD